MIKYYWSSDNLFQANNPSCPILPWLQMNYYVTKIRGHGSQCFIFEKWNKDKKERKKSLGPFRICLLNRTANPANLHLDWAVLAVLFSRQVLNGPQDIFLIFISFFKYETIETRAPAFLSHNNSSVARVIGLNYWKACYVT